MITFEFVYWVTFNIPNYPWHAKTMFFFPSSQPKCWEVAKGGRFGGLSYVNELSKSTDYKPSLIK